MPFLSFGLGHKNNLEICQQLGRPIIQPLNGVSKYNHTVEIDNFASRRSRVPERQKIVKLNCVARDLQTYVIKDLRGQPKTQQTKFAVTKI